jgi:hypothetical protein
MCFTSWEEKRKMVYYSWSLVSISRRAIGTVYYPLPLIMGWERGPEYLGFLEGTYIG